MSSARFRLGVGAALALATWFAFAGVGRLEFLGYDDGPYVTENPRVRAGLGADGLAWSLTSRHAANWHPLTWVSHMLDVELFGVEPGPHHLVSLALHAATVVLLFLVLLRLTGARWQSAFAAALFGLHPLRVESVAWIAERKDVLAGLFLVLTLYAWQRYAESRRAPPYLAAVALFAASLAAKPIGVTLPFALLLLDWWPLGRLRLAAPAGPAPPTRPAPLPVTRLLVEKLPLFALAAVSSGLTLWAQAAGGALAPFDTLPLGERLANAAVACARYLGMTFLPTDLAVFYPHPAVWPALAVAGSLGLLLAITLACGLPRRRHAYLMVGWLWFLGTLVPMLGIVQAGAQSLANRYTYLPSIGLAVALAWGSAALVTRFNVPRRTAAAAAAFALLALVIHTRAEVAFWTDDGTLFRRALAVTRDNHVAHLNLGVWLARREDASALEHLAEAARLQPTWARARHVLGLAHARRGDLKRALSELREAVRLAPDLGVARFNLGAALVRGGDLAAAAQEFEALLALEPTHAAAHDRLAHVRARQGRTADAVVLYRRTLALDADQERARRHLAWILATSGDPGLRDPYEATQLALAANARSGGDQPEDLDTLAAAHASAGRYELAVEVALRAAERARHAGRPRLAAAIDGRTALYREGRAYVE